MSENKSQTPAQNTPENSEKKKVSLFALIVVLVVAVIVMVALFVRSNTCPVSWMRSTVSWPPATPNSADHCRQGDGAGGTDHRAE